MTSRNLLFFQRNRKVITSFPKTFLSASPLSLSYNITATATVTTSRLLSSRPPKTQCKNIINTSKPSRHLSSLPIVDDEHDESHDEEYDHGHHSPPPPHTPSLTRTTKEEEREDVTITSTTKQDDMISPSHISYVAGVSLPITSELHIVKPSDDAPPGLWPVYRIMDENGSFRNNNNDGFSFLKEEDNDDPSNLSQQNIGETYDSNHTNNKQNDIFALKNKLSQQYPQHKHTIQSSHLFQTSNDNQYKSYAETSSSINESQISNQNDRNCILLRAHRVMARLRQMDDILLNAQRQGRISFYMTCRGEEGIHVGSASALTMDDVVLAQYREQGILMWRGFTLDQFTNQCFTNDLDLGRGRQMPVHYGSRALNYHTISSPLGTQLPQAVGVAYKMKLDKLARNAESKMDNSTTSQSRDNITIAYFGDGAASTTDFHCALNFATTLKVPMIFFCRNNGYAISTKVSEQYAGDGIVSRSKGYGMAAIRVDGNDLFAVHAATKAARDYAIQHSEPVLIEAITYRQGHHSSSDDSKQYRSVGEVNESENAHDPLKRFESFLIEQKWTDENELSAISKEERTSVLRAMERAEQRPPPKLETMFQDVYKDMPLNLMMQEKNLQKHMKRNPGKY